LTKKKGAKEDKSYQLYHNPNQILHSSYNNSLFNIFSFSQNNYHFWIQMLHLLFFSHYHTFIYWTSSNLTTLLTTINKSILVNDINFTIEINTINHFLNNRAQTLIDYNLETEGVMTTILTRLRPLLNAKSLTKNLLPLVIFIKNKRHKSSRPKKYIENNYLHLICLYI